MKKNLLSLTLVMCLLFISGMTVHAEEEATKPTIEERFAQRMDEQTQKRLTLVEEKTASFEERKATAQEGQTKKLALINLYAPEMYDAYLDAFADHVTVHEQLFQAHKSLRLEASEMTATGLSNLKDTLLPMVEDGTMTGKEMGQELRAYLQEQKTYLSSVKDQYKAEIEAINTENETNKELAKSLKSDLRLAIEAEDVDTANALITELYDYLLAHTQYDYEKLEVLEAVEF